MNRVDAAAEVRHGQVGEGDIETADVKYPPSIIQKDTLMI
jgi:hypothetical protein